MPFETIIEKLDETDALMREEMDVQGTPTGSLPSS